MNTKTIPWLKIAAFSLFIVCISAPAFAAATPSTAGTWKWSVAPQNGDPFEAKLTLKQEGNTLTGVMIGRNNTETAIQAGKISGNEITFTVTRERGGQQFTQKYQGKITGDAIKGTIAREGQDPRDWEAKREAAAANATGTWKWSFTGQDGTTRESTLKLKQAGDTLTGVVIGRNNTETAIAGGKIKGNEVSFKLIREFNGQSFTQAYLGKISGDIIKGNISMERDGQTSSREWEAKREKSAVNVTGTWKWTMTIPNGPTIESTLKLNHSGETLSGVMVRNDTETAIEGAKIKDGDITFQVTRERNGEKFVIKYSGKISSDGIKGKISSNFGGEERTFDWDAKKAAE